MVVFCLCSNILKDISLKSFVTSVFWDRNSSLGRGNDLRVEDVPCVFIFTSAFYSDLAKYINVCIKWIAHVQ